MEFELIQCCCSSVLSYLNLYELCQMNVCIWNKSIQESLNYLLLEYKTNHVMYRSILCHKFSQKEIQKCEILFFIEHYLNQTKYRDFKSFLFGMFEDLFSSMPEPKYFYLSTRRYRLFFIYQISKDIILILVQICNHSIFYNISIRNQNDEIQSSLPLTGYLIQNNKPIRDKTFILSLFSSSIYNNE